MKKIAIALALSASMALIACGEEAKKEEPKKADKAPAKEAKADADKDAKKAAYHAKIKKDLEQNCALKLTALTGSKEDKEKAKAFNAEFQEQYAKTPAAKVKAFKAEIKACADLKSAKDSKKAAKPAK